jgi:hypothetical protein
MKIRVWTRNPIVEDDIQFPIRERTPKDIDVYPLVIGGGDKFSIIGINPKWGYVLFRDGLKSEEKPLKELWEMYPDLLCGAWGWEKEFIKGLKRRKQPVDPCAADRELAVVCRSEGWKDVAHVEHGQLFSEDGQRIRKEYNGRTL